VTASRGCVQTELLGEYIAGRLDVSLRATVEAHLALCPRCRSVTEAAVEATGLGITSAEIRARIAEASAVVASLEAEPPHRLQALITNAEWGADRYVAGRLLERSREEFHRDPRKAMVLARAAVSVSERAGSKELQFEGWRDRVSIAVYLGALADAWDAVEQAAALAPMLRDHVHATGIVLYARAYVASQPDVWQLDDALRWIGEAEVIFEKTDAERFRAAAEMRAYLHYCVGEYDAAVAICRDIWRHNRSMDLALSFVAYLVESGELAEAETVLSWATSRVDDADVERLAALAWAEGRLHVARGAWQQAAEALRLASSRFRAVGMDDTAIRVDLARVGAELSAAPESVQVLQTAMTDIRRLIAISAELDEREPTRRRRFTVEAIGYLRELADANALTLDLFAQVEEYLSAITRGPARPFVRPAPVHVM
jgi:tetratricopeptide (TPR) repeat protein